MFKSSIRPEYTAKAEDTKMLVGGVYKHRATGEGASIQATRQEGSVLYGLLVTFAFPPERIVQGSPRMNEFELVGPPWALAEAVMISAEHATPPEDKALPPAPVRADKDAAREALLREIANEEDALPLPTKAPTSVRHARK